MSTAACHCPSALFTPDASENGNHAELKNGASLEWNALNLGSYGGGYAEAAASESLVLGASDFTIEASSSG